MNLPSSCPRSACCQSGFASFHKLSETSIDPNLRKASMQEPPPPPPGKGRQGTHHVDFAGCRVIRTIRLAKSLTTLAFCFGQASAEAYGLRKGSMILRSSYHDHGQFQHRMPVTLPSNMLEQASQLLYK